MMGSHASVDFEGMIHGMVCGKLIDDFPVDIDITDMHNTRKMFGPDLEGLQGWTVRQILEGVLTSSISLQC